MTVPAGGEGASERETTHIAVIMDGNAWEGEVRGKATEIERSFLQSALDGRMAAHFDLVEFPGRIFFMVSKVLSWEIRGVLDEVPNMGPRARG